MGKFRSKPTRVVAKPFRKNSTKSTEPKTLPPPVQPISFSKISKRPPPKSRVSALKKNTATTSATSLGQGEPVSSSPASPKKSVTFASPSSNTVHVFPPSSGGHKNKADAIRALLKDGAGALVNMVSGGVKNLKLKGPGNSYNVNSHQAKREDSSSNSLNKVLRNQFKDKRTRRKLRKEAFHKKLSLMKESDEEAKAEQRRKDTVIVGDMQPIAKILEELEEQVKAKAASEGSKPSVLPKKKRRTLKKREQEMLDALKFFEAAGV